MHNKFLSPFFNTLNFQAISYCVWGNYELLPDSLNGSDLDIVVPEDNKISFKLVLKNHI